MRAIPMGMRNLLKCMELAVKGQSPARLVYDKLSGLAQAGAQGRTPGCATVGFVGLMPLQQVAKAHCYVSHGPADSCFAKK